MCITVAYVGHGNFHSYNLLDSLIRYVHIHITLLLLIPEGLFLCIKHFFITDTKLSGNRNILLRLYNKIIRYLNEIYICV